MYAIQVENVSKTYPNGVQALSNLSLTIQEGEVFSLLGKNGAGKSTLIHILTSLAKHDTGNITVFDKDLQKDNHAIRFLIACVFQRVSVDTNLTLTENMMFQSKLYKIPHEEALARMKQLIHEFELSSYEKYPIASYSGGIKRRLDIAVNMMSNPKILFLDEPTVGMDIQSRKAMWRMIQKIRNDFHTTIVLTTHYLEEADALSDTICILRDGHAVCQGSPNELKQYLKQDTIRIQFLDKEALSQTKQLLDTLSRSYTLDHREIRIDTKNSHDLQELTAFVLKHDIAFKGIERSQPTLEDVFLRLTKKEDNA